MFLVLVITFEHRLGTTVVANYYTKSALETIDFITKKGFKDCGYNTWVKNETTITIQPMADFKVFESFQESFGE